MVDRIEKFLDSLDERTRRRIFDKLAEVKKNPFSVSGVKKLKGWGECVYRVRIGNIRVIYKILKDDIEIIDMDFRGNIYK